jgi:hypothetical protein
MKTSDKNHPRSIKNRGWLIALLRKRIHGVDKSNINPNGKPENAQYLPSDAGFLSLLKFAS